MREHTLDNSSTDTSSSFLTWWSSKQRLETLYNCSTFLNANSQYRSTHFWACPHHRTTRLFVREVSATPVILMLLQQKYVTQTCSCTVQWLFHSAYIHVECTPSTHGQEMMLVRQYLHFSSIKFFHMGAIFCFFPAILMSSTQTDRNNTCFRWTNIHSQFGISSHPSSNRTSSNCFSTGCFRMLQGAWSQGAWGNSCCPL